VVAVVGRGKENEGGYRSPLGSAIQPDDVQFCARNQIRPIIFSFMIPDRRAKPNMKNNYFVVLVYLRAR
jgi:hypothetical protein